MREKQHQRGLSAGYLEPDRYEEDEEGEESISLSAIKSKYKSGGLRGEEEEATAYGSQENNKHNSGWDYLPAYLSKLSVICSPPCRTLAALFGAGGFSAQNVLGKVFQMWMASENN